MNEDNTIQPETPENIPQEPIAPPAIVPSAPVQPVTPTVPTPQSTDPATQPTIYPISANSMPSEKRSKKPFIISLILLIIMVAVGAAGYFASTLPGQLKTVSYDNGEGNTYKLKFYTKHEIKDTAFNTGKKWLVATEGKGGKTPVVMRINGNTQSVSQQDYEQNTNVNCWGNEPVATVRNEWSQRDVKICALKNEELGIDTMYIATLWKNDRMHVIQILQNAKFNELAGGENDPKSQVSAQKLLKEAGLNTYKDDIQNIIASIEVIK